MIATMLPNLASRSILLALGLGFALASACFDDSVLENADCIDDDDCAKSQYCHITDYQRTSTASKYGWCRPKGEDCAVGEQPGCWCAANTVSFTCESHDGVQLCPTSQLNDCTCVLPEHAGGMPGETSCPPPPA
jgi:hypothetical protein